MVKRNFTVIFKTNSSNLLHFPVCYKKLFVLKPSTTNAKVVLTLAQATNCVALFAFQFAVKLLKLSCKHANTEDKTINNKQSSVMVRYYTQILITIAIMAHYTTCDQQDEMDWLKQLVNSGYNRQTPYNSTSRGKAKLEIKCNIDPSTITSISIQSMDFEIEMSLTIVWLDNRLMVSKEFEENLKKSKKAPFQLPQEEAMKIWIPYLQFKNCKKCELLVLDIRRDMMDIHPTSTGSFLSVRYRKTFQFTCSYDLTLYPFDTQTCSMDLQLRNVTGYLLELNLERQNASITVPPEFHVLSQDVQKCTEVKSLNKHSLPFQCQQYSFKLRRNLGSYIVLIYIPSILIIIISWLAFWLDVQVAAPRVALGLTALLTLAILFNNAQNKLPSVAYVKALDVWVLFNMCFVFASITEFAVANFFARRRANSYQVENSHPPSANSINQLLDRQTMARLANSNTVRRPGQRKNSNWPTPVGTNRYQQLSPNSRPPTSSSVISTNIIDIIARIIFPILFIIFNVVYWSYYLHKYAN